MVTPVVLGVPQASRGREGGIDHAHVAATAPTPPMSHNASQTTPCDEAQSTWVIIVIREAKGRRAIWKRRFRC